VHTTASHPIAMLHSWYWVVYHNLVLAVLCCTILEYLRSPEVFKDGGHSVPTSHMIP
jgi:hypothetical protein